MFAVPGWNVPVKSLVQQQARKDGDVVGSKKAKKRKRDGDHSHEAAIAKALKSYQASDASPGAETLKEKINTIGLQGKKSNEPRSKKSNSDQTVANSETSASVESVEESPYRAEKKGQTQEKEGTIRKKSSKREGRRQNKDEEQSTDTTIASQKPPKTLSSLPPPPPPISRLTPLQIKMRSKLTSARFRHLNETLYTTTSSDALNLFTTSPDLFAEYHAGFAQQVKDSWPQNPVESYVKAIKTRGALSNPSNGILPLPRRKTGSCTIADLGCGDAPLARGCQANIKSLQLKFHNYDLHAPNSLVTKADVSNLPLRDGEADIVVFCLSLMGTNWIAFVEEAWRVLRGDGKGEVWVAEVKSRFGRVTKGRVVENSVGKRRKPMRKTAADDGFDGPEQFAEDVRTEDQVDDETDISAFVKVFTRRGFQLREDSVNKGNKMFASMVFIKSGIPTAGKHKGLKWNGKEYVKQEDGKMRFTNGPRKDDEEVSPEEEAKVLKPCVYKVR